MNTLYYGDNLDILTGYRTGKPIPSDSVDLIYLDPPFNSNATYNMLFDEQDGSRSAAQIKAFKDTWRWDQGAMDAYAITMRAGGKAAAAMDGFSRIIPESNMLAYLAMMAPRLMELKRVLKPTGSIYLHCDPTASHYLKVLMDAIYEPKNYRNEIIWERTNSHNMRSSGYPKVNDTLLFYSKSGEFTFNTIYSEYGQAQMKRYKVDEQGRQYKGDDLTFSGVNPARQFEWRGTKPPPNRSWGAPIEQLEQWYAETRILLKKNGSPRLDGHKIYLDDTKGKPLGTNWTDIPRVPNTAAERLGYPTQKPRALLARIIEASSNPGDLVLDPFCGCGTAIETAHELGRQWIGIDITPRATGLVKYRLRNAFGDRVQDQYTVIGEPVDLAGAIQLALDDRETNENRFESWALGLVNAREKNGEDRRKGPDRGMDGVLYFDDTGRGLYKRVLLQVKSGHVGRADVATLGNDTRREGAEIGVLITLKEPTQGMRGEVASGGFYESPWGHYPHLQILTIEQLLDGKKINMPPLEQVNMTFRKAPSRQKTRTSQPELIPNV